jgi:hypothetical protein
MSFDVCRPEVVTRKELAALAGVHYDTLRRNERRLGLDAYRFALNARYIRYYRRPAILVLVRAGLLVRV